MATLKELRVRIASVKSTRKITAAMRDIASARLPRAQRAVLAARPYGERMQEVVDHLVGGIDPADPSSAHPLLRRRDLRRVGVILLTADRGLCGGFNANANREAARLHDEHRDAGHEIVVFAVGKKARSYLKHSKIPMAEAFDGPETKNVIPLSKRVCAAAMAAFLDTAKDQQVDAVFVIYNHFVSGLSQQVRRVQLLPVQSSINDSEWRREPKLEPDKRTLLEHLLPVAVESVIQQAMFNSVASEIAARRAAMDAATTNASELIDQLTLQYNRERQAAITKELMEIIGGAEAIKG